MTGKVFSESTNIYQDQAKVLFDYYKAAAEKIVSEEMAAEQDKADLVEQKNRAEHRLKTAKAIYPIGLVAGIVSILLGIVLPVMFLISVAAFVVGIKYYIDRKKEMELLENNKKLTEEVEARYQNIRRDYLVKKVGVAYVPIATRVPFEDKSFLIDHTNTVGDTSFLLNVLHQPDNFQESIQNLQKCMESMPVVENNETPEEVDTAEYSISMQNITLHDYVGNIDRQVRNVSYLLNDSENVSVNLPVIMPDSEQADMIREYTTEDTGDKPVVTVFDVNFDDRLSKFSSLNALKDQIKNSEDSDNTDYMKHLMSRLAQSVQILSKTKNSSSSKLKEYTFSIFSNVLKASYTQYSPALEAEEIERIRATNFDYRTSVNDYSPFSLNPSSRMKYDMFSGNWVAEDGSRTSMPFGMHQVDEEVLMPVINFLMQENRIERLKIYSNIEDQKRLYLDKWLSETGNYYRDNRKSADELITHMREAYAEYMGALNMYKSLNSTADQMKSSNDLAQSEVKETNSQDEMVLGFEEQAKNCNLQQEQFSDFMDRVQESITESTNLFSHIEYYEGSLRDSVSHDTAVAHANIHGLDDRRKKLISVSPYMANYAELPPVPRTSPEMFEHAGIDLEQQVSQNIEEIDNKMSNILYSE